MKKQASKLCFIFVLGLVAVSIQSCNNTPADNTTSLKVAAAEDQTSGEVKAYYFHGTSRCVTCEAVESVTIEALKEYYGDKVTFESINREEEKDHPLVLKYQISGQTLLIINGDTKVDLTNDAFLNARTNPDKFISKLKSTIDSMM